jgi:hypothetical protein
VAPDDIIASKVAANRVKDRESLPRRAPFRELLAETSVAVDFGWRESSGPIRRLAAVEARKWSRSTFML